MKSIVRNKPISQQRSRLARHYFQKILLVLKLAKQDVYIANEGFDHEKQAKTAKESSGVDIEIFQCLKCSYCVTGYVSGNQTE